MLGVGSTAPDFELPNQDRQPVRLSSFRDKRHVVVAFHPLAFTPVCSAQMQTYEKARPRLDGLNAHVVAISLDANPSKKAWSEALGGISFDLLSDCHPHGKVTRDYDVMGEHNLAERAVFVVDKSGRIVWAERYDMGEQPNHEALFKVLETLG